jgi:protein-disulfide isomerase
MRDSIDLSKQPALGALMPKVTIVEYSDLQCGYCKQMSGILRDLLKEFGSQVRLYVKDYPLKDIHPWAGDAAVIGRCVLQQNEDAFWAYHDWAYEKQEELNVKNLSERARAFLAGKKNVDNGRFEACMKGPEARAEVDRSVKEAQSLGINTTPTLFVNGRRLVGSQTLAALRQVVQLELERLKHVEGTVRLVLPPR